MWFTACTASHVNNTAIWLVFLDETYSAARVKNLFWNNYKAGVEGVIWDGTNIILFM